MTSETSSLQLELWYVFNRRISIRSMWEYRLYICLDFFIFFQPQIQQKHWTLLLDSLVVECWLRVREVPGSIPNQGPRHTKDVIKMVPVVLLFGTQHYKVKYWLFLKNKDRTKNVMDKIWDRNPSKSEAVVAGIKKRMVTQNQWSSRTAKSFFFNLMYSTFHFFSQNIV